MTSNDFSSPNRLFAKLNKGMLSEHAAFVRLKRTEAAMDYTSTQAEILETVKAIGQTGDVDAILKTERALINNEKRLYSNSPAMKISLEAALKDLEAAEKCRKLVDDEKKYRAVNTGHGHHKNRIGDLPKDAVRQFISSHYTRLLNMDKARLTKTEKQTISARRTNLRIAEKAYSAKQERAVGREPRKQADQGMSR